jgi:tyrosyl-tRNA synthetase
VTQDLRVGGPAADTAGAGRTGPADEAAADEGLRRLWSGGAPPAGAEVLVELAGRGVLAQCTEPAALAAELAAGPITLYCGFDPTAPSLHLGHLVQLLTLRRFQLAGHRPIAVVGGATGLIGDPSFRSTERALNDADVVAGWVRRIERQVRPFLSFDGPNAALVVDNLEWTAGLSAIALLRDVGRHFPVNRMLARQSVRTRLDAGLSYTEFSYVLLQALDYLELHRRHDCRLQVGGSDQWGNITAGVELVRRVDNTAVHALTTRLLTRADGTKFGKTAGGAIWLDPELTSPYAFYQFWLNTPDADVVDHLRTFTFLPAEELDALRIATLERPASRAAQRRLAEEVTTLVHGADEYRRAVEASRAVFGGGDLTAVDAGTLEAALAEAGLVELAWPWPSLDELFVAAGLAPSRSAARRAIEQGGGYVNNVRVSDPARVPGAEQLLHGRFLVLRHGRRHVAGLARPGRGAA